VLHFEGSEDGGNIVSKPLKAYYSWCNPPKLNFSIHSCQLSKCNAHKQLLI
jgi:hypothetical protein